MNAKRKKILVMTLILSFFLVSGFLFFYENRFTGNAVGEAVDTQTSQGTTAASASESTTTYIYAGNLLASKTSNSDTTTYYLQDHLGSNIEVLENTTIGQKSQFYVFGESNITSKDNKYLYTGKELDYESGLYYYGARYYDPAIGRFLQADVLQGGISQPSSLNRYAYTSNNPLKYVDSTGNKQQKTPQPDSKDEIVVPESSRTIYWGFIQFTFFTSSETREEVTEKQAEQIKKFIKENYGQEILDAAMKEIDNRVNIKYNYIKNSENSLGGSKKETYVWLRREDYVKDSIIVADALKYVQSLKDKENTLKAEELWATLDYQTKYLISEALVKDFPGLNKRVWMETAKEYYNSGANKKMFYKELTNEQKKITQKLGQYITLSK